MTVDELRRTLEGLDGSLGVMLLRDGSDYGPSYLVDADVRVVSADWDESYKVWLPRGDGSRRVVEVF